MKIMYPMISSLDEIREANQILNEVKASLSERGIPYDANIEVGIMIEVPAAVVIADLLAREVDFFSIGTNDLVQYVLAVDRMNEQIAHLYQPFHPSVLRLLRMTAEAAHAAGISVSVCGELAGDERAVPIWLSLGIHNLSMSPQSLLRVKHRVLNTEAAEAVKVAKSCLTMSTGKEIEAELEKYKRNSTQSTSLS